MEEINKNYENMRQWNNGAYKKEKKEKMKENAMI